MATQQDRLIGQVFGRFRLESKAGEGGMGSVYIGRRVGDFEQSVAVKLLLNGLHHAQNIERFRAEQQALAALQHPNIVNLIDGGVSPDGIPFLVMDYVRGEHLNRYCDERRLGVGERVDLAVRILEAVHHAHQRQMAHCDLKFSNILVTEDGEPKLLDFGVAKLLAPEQYGLGGATVDAAMRPFTPEFASPEQLNGDPLTISTDLYSIGVLLYLLLTGTHPFESMRQQPVAFMRAVCEVAPELPSSRVAALEKSDAERARAIAEQRGCAPKELAKKLEGDLDAIVLQALRKTPEDRYRTAGAFAADLLNFQSQRPVEARKGSRRYRLWKYVQRNKVMVTAGVLAIATGLAGAGTTLWQNVKAERSRAEAQRRFAEGRKLTNALLFDFYDALQQLPGSTAAQQSLVQWSLSYLDNLSKQGFEDPALREELAEGYRRLADLQGNPYENNLGKPQEGLATIDRGLALLEPVLAKEPDQRSALLARARLIASRNDLQATAGQVEQALKERKQNLELLDRLVERFPQDYDVLSEAFSQHETYGDLLNESLTNVGDYEGAIREYRVAQKLAERAQKADPSQNRPKRALVVFGMKIADQTATTDPALAVQYFAQTKQLYDKLPEEMLRQVQTRRLGASLLRRYGWSLVALHKADEAIPLYKQSLDYYEQLNKLDPANVRGQWDIAVVSRNLAHAHQQRQEWKTATEYFQRIETLMEPVIKQLPEGIQRAYGEMLVEKGAAELKVGQLAQGRKAAQRGLNILVNGIEKVDVVTELERVAECLLTVEPRDLQNVQLARTLLIRAGGEKPNSGWRTISLLATAESRVGNGGKARALAKTALDKLPPGDVTPYRSQMTALLGQSAAQQLPK